MCCTGDGGRSFSSHSYDHLDVSSILAIMKRFPHARYFVPLGPSPSFSALSVHWLTHTACTGNKAWFVNTGVEEKQVYEMDWWEDMELCPEELSYEADEVDVKAASRLRLTCVPAQHNSGRSSPSPSLGAG